MADIDLPGLLKAASDFFGLTRKQLCLAFAVMMTALVTAFIDYSGRITEVPRWALITFYLFGLVCFFFLLAAAMSHHFGEFQSRREARHAEDAQQDEALSNLAAAGTLHQACLVFLKRRGTKRFSADWWNILRDMSGSGFLTWTQATHDLYWWEVPDSIWNSNELARWAEKFPPVTGPPWEPPNFMNWQ